MFRGMFRTYDYQIGPLVLTKVLNTDECNVAAVGVTMFNHRLCYRERGKWSPTEIGITRVLMLSGTWHKELCPPNNYQAEFDIYLADGRVIEVSTYQRSVIEAALVYAPKKDVRGAFRANRGRL